MTVAHDDRDTRQSKVASWASKAFGVEQSTSLPQRGIRFAEEAIETAQAAGCTREMLHRLVDHIFDRPVGDLPQELGGASVTLLALAASAALSLDECEAREIDRILAKPLAHFTERNARKNAAGFCAA